MLDNVLLRIPVFHACLVLVGSRRDAGVGREEIDIERARLASGGRGEPADAAGIVDFVVIVRPSFSVDAAVGDLQPPPRS